MKTIGRIGVGILTLTLVSCTQAASRGFTEDDRCDNADFAPFGTSFPELTSEQRKRVIHLVRAQEEARDQFQLLWTSVLEKNEFPEHALFTLVKKKAAEGKCQTSYTSGGRSGGEEGTVENIINGTDCPVEVNYTYRGITFPTESVIEAHQILSARYKDLTLGRGNLVGRTLEGPWRIRDVEKGPVLKLSLCGELEGTLETVSEGVVPTYFVQDELTQRPSDPLENPEGKAKLYDFKQHTRRGYRLPDFVAEVEFREDRSGKSVTINGVELTAEEMALEGNHTWSAY